MSCECGDDCQCAKRSCACKFVLVLMFALALVLAGFFPGYFYYRAKMDNNYVTVKGLAEMDVKADLAVWNLRFVVTDNDLLTAKNKMDDNLATIIEFLKKAGFGDAEINAGKIETNDLLANPYGGDNSNKPRYILGRNVSVTSNNVDLIDKTMNLVGDLVSKGVVFDNQAYGNAQVAYIFTRLNEIKPQMLEMATKNAFEAAEEFAKSSNSEVGKIRRASQGVFAILPKNKTQEYQSEMQFIDKTVRVVSTIDYYLQ